MGRDEVAGRIQVILDTYLRRGQVDHSNRMLWDQVSPDAHTRIFLLLLTFVLRSLDESEQRAEDQLRERLERYLPRSQHPADEERWRATVDRIADAAANLKRAYETSPLAQDAGAIYRSAWEQPRLVNGLGGTATCSGDNANQKNVCGASVSK